MRLLLFLATARVLAPPEFSVYALLTAALATSQWLFSLGGPRVALYFYAQGERGRLFGWLYVLAAGAATAVLGVVALSPWLRETFFWQVPAGWALVGLAPLPFSLLADSLAATLIAAGRTRAYGATLWMRNGLTAAVVASSLLSHHPLFWILAGRLVVQVAVALTTALLARAKPDWRRIPGLTFPVLRYGGPTALSESILALHRRADVFLLSALGKTSEIGAYAVVYLIAEAFWLVTDSLEAAFFVDVTRQDPEAARAAARKAFRIYLVLGFIGLVGGIAVGEGLLALLFRQRYPAAPMLLPWLVSAAVAWGVSRPFYSFLLARARVRSVLICHLIGLAINLLLNLLWIPQHGAAGAAMACLISYGIESVTFWIAFRSGRSHEG